MRDLSIILPTCNRAVLLDRALESIAAGTKCDFEIIVVDGASTDETPGILVDWRDRLGNRLRVMTEDKREGFVRAANKGFRSARGRMLCWINDDSRPLDGALDQAVTLVGQGGPSLGFVGLFHRWHLARNVAYTTERDGNPYSLCHVRGTLYANFPVGRREVWEKLDYLDERYFLNAADPDLSLKAWHAGLRVEPALGALIDHDQAEDARRDTDAAVALADNTRLFEKWDLPPKNLDRNDFDPGRPCTLRGLRSVTSAA